MSSTNRAHSSSRGRWRWLVLLVVVSAAAFWWFQGRGGGNGEQAYRTEPVERGEIRTAISATGALSAITTVDVGTQVSGTLQSVDVDYNDVVKKDQIIAHIEPSTFQARVNQAAATLASARASVEVAQATARNAEADYQRKADLAKRQLVSRTDVDQALATRDQARAQTLSAKAQVQQQSAALDSARLDLEKTVIRSPVDGVVLQRAVEPGQTVAASLQTPVLFKIAGDLRQMEIVLTIDESDIGQVRVGLPVRFTVDAFPDRSFPGRVSQVRLAATNTANVITYPVVVQLENSDLALLPGMTANAEIEINRRSDVLSVPNAALRFRPVDAGTAGDAAAAGSNAGGNPGAGRGGAAMIDTLSKVADRLKLDAAQRSAFDAAAESVRQRMQAARQAAGNGAGNEAGGRAGNGANAAFAGNRSRNGGGNNGNSGRMAERIKQSFAPFRATLDAQQQALWDGELGALASVKRATVYKLADGKPEQVSVRIGASDGTRTEIIGDGVAEGDKVIVGSAQPAVSP